MSIITQSPGLANLAVYNLLIKIVGSTSDRCHLYLMKGRRPLTLDSISDPDIFRRSDRLVHWGRKQIKISSTGVISLNASQATKSGVANWFYLYREYQGKIFQAIGSVGLIGSSSDIEFATTNIISGKTYGVNDFDIDVPESFDDDDYNTVAPVVVYQIAVIPSIASWQVEASNTINVVPSQHTWTVEVA